MNQERNKTGRFKQTVTDQKILNVFDYEDDPVLSASEVAEGVRRVKKHSTSEGIRNRLEAVAEEGLVSRKKLDARAVGWCAEVAPELDAETAETVDTRKETDDWSELWGRMAAVLLHSDVEKKLQQLPNDIESRIRSKLADAGQHPDRHLRPLKRRHEYSLRIGKRRAIIDWVTSRKNFGC
jgi:mRNA-degrading endonuclease RelE of RelBE toxin-antitoxin system